MSKVFDLDRSMMLTALTVLGMVVAILGWWPHVGPDADLATIAGLALVYLAGGLPAALRAGGALWKERE